MLKNNRYITTCVNGHLYYRFSKYLNMPWRGSICSMLHFCSCLYTYRHLPDIWPHYYWVNTPRSITQNSLSNNISTKMYFKSKTKQYLLWCFNTVLWLITWWLRFFLGAPWIYTAYIPVYSGHGMLVSPKGLGPTYARKGRILSGADVICYFSMFAYPRTSANFQYRYKIVIYTDVIPE